MLLFAGGTWALDSCLLKPGRILGVPGCCTSAAVFSTVLLLSWACMPAVTSVNFWLADSSAESSVRKDMNRERLLPQTTCLHSYMLFPCYFTAQVFNCLSRVPIACAYTYHNYMYLLHMHIPAATACTYCICTYLLQLHVPIAYAKAVQLLLLTVGWWHCSRAWPVSTAP